MTAKKGDQWNITEPQGYEVNFIAATPPPPPTFPTTQ